MTTNLPLTDAAIEAALARCAERISGDGLQEQIMAGVARMSQSRPPLAARLGWLPWPASSLRLVWVVVITGLLLALVVGSVFVGAQRPDHAVVIAPSPVPLAACPPGSNPDRPGPVDQARPLNPPNQPPAMAFDRRAGRLVALTSAGNAPETWTFDVCTNTWTQQHPEQQPLGVDEWDLFVYDVDSDLTIAVHYGTVWAYDLQADTWTRKGNGPVAARLGAYDPLTGLVVAATDADPVELWTYDVEGDTWTPVHLGNGAPVPRFGGALAYDASVDRFVWYRDWFGGLPYQTWLLDLRTGTWTRSGAERPPVTAWLVGPRLVYDEAAERTVVFMRGPLTAYDASTDRWEILAAAETVSPTQMAYDSVNRRLVGWGTGGMGPPEGAVEALDLATGKWTVLLEPTPGQPTPGPE